jgi:hypothetical protein
MKKFTMGMVNVFARTSRLPGTPSNSIPRFAASVSVCNCYGYKLE